MKSSTIIPAPPTANRCHLLRNAHAEEASTYGTGVSTRIITPISCTSPPRAFTANACPNSWQSFSTGKTSHIISRFSGRSTRSSTSWLSSRQCVTAVTMPSPTTMHHSTKPAEPEERPRERHQPVEQPLGIEQRDLPGEDAEDLLHQQPLLLFLAAPEELGGVGRDVALEDVGRVQLAEELDHLVLGHGVVAELRERSVPDLLDGVLAVHQPDHEVGRRREAVEALRGEILQHVPGLAAVLVAVDLGMRPQQRRELRDPVPGRAEELLRHPLRGARTRGSAAGS